jgi:hypothetical protein
MEFTDNGLLKVGKTTLSTPVQIRIPVYGYELPEINSSSPIPMPMYTSVSNIINWLERGIDVEFSDNKDREKVFFFVLEYNRFVLKENKKIEDPDKQLRPATNAEQNLFKRIDFTSYINKKEADGMIPFKRKPFKGKVKPENKGQVSTSYKNPNIKNKLFGGIAAGIREAAIVTPEESRAYDLFTPSLETGVIGKGQFDNIELD